MQPRHNRRLSHEAVSPSAIPPQAKVRSHEADLHAGRGLALSLYRPQICLIIGAPPLASPLHTRHNRRLSREAVAPFSRSPSKAKVRSQQADLHAGRRLAPCLHRLQICLDKQAANKWATCAHVFTLRLPKMRPFCGRLTRRYCSHPRLTGYIMVFRQSQGVRNILARKH